MSYFMEVQACGAPTPVWYWQTVEALGSKVKFMIKAVRTLWSVQRLEVEGT